MSYEVDFAEPYLETMPVPGPTPAPQFFEVSIAGRRYYALDTSFEPYRRDAFRHRSIQAQRESISLDNVPGEGTVNTEGLWRREAVDWHFGAGQPYQDRKDSVDSRFSVSKGVNPWMQWQLELLDDTTQVFATTDPNAQIMAAGQMLLLMIPSASTIYAYVAGSWSIVLTSTPGLAGMATDGYNIWVGCGNGIWTTTTGLLGSRDGNPRVWTHYIVGDQLDGIWFVGERLMATIGPNVYNVTSGATSVQLTSALIVTNSYTSLNVTPLTEAVTSGDTITVGPSNDGSFIFFSQQFTASANASIGASSISVTSQAANFSYPVGTNVVDQQWATGPAPLWTHPNPNFVFSAMAAGSSQIYLAGYDSTGLTNSLVYRTTIEATGTALTIPVQALPLEGGEYCTSLYGYLNYVFVGTNLGVRMCRTIAAYDPTGNEGDLEAGPIYPGLFPPGPVSSPVHCMVGNNRFVYFGWSNYDSVSTGIGRSDLSTFIDTQAPAFAADLMVTGRGLVTSMDWSPITNAPIFVVAGSGVYTSTNSPVESGYVRSGLIGYGIADDKIALGASLGAVQPQSGSVAMSLAADYNANIFAFVGSSVSADMGGNPTPGSFATGAIRAQNFTVEITLSRDTVTNASPVLNRWTLKAIPAVTAGTTISVVLRLWETEDIQGQNVPFDPYEEKAFLESLRTTQSVFEYVEGPYVSQYTTVDEIDWLPEKFRDANPAGGYQGNLIVYLKTWDINA